MMNTKQMAMDDGTTVTLTNGYWTNKAIDAAVFYGVNANNICDVKPLGEVTLIILKEAIHIDGLPENIKINHFHFQEKRLQFVMYNPGNGTNILIYELRDDRFHRVPF